MSVDICEVGSLFHEGVDQILDVTREVARRGCVAKIISERKEPVNDSDWFCTNMRINDYEPCGLF
jgi:hypothetical protein